MCVSPKLEVCPAVSGTGRKSGARLLAETVGADSRVRFGQGVVGRSYGLHAGSCLRQICGCPFRTRHGRGPWTGLRWCFDASRPLFGDAK